MVFEDSDLNTTLVIVGADFTGLHLVRALLVRGRRVRANLLAAERPEAAGIVLNVSGEESVSILDLAETLSGILSGVPAPKFTPTWAGVIYLFSGRPQPC